jgi:transcriptional repressor NrdR
MRCPECQHPDSRVVDSRTSGDAIRRRRACERCGARFTTHERLEPRLLWVVKKSGVREPFSRDKVMAGIALACRKRPIDTAQIEAAARHVEARLDATGATEVTTPDVGAAVLDVLRSLDAVAYVRFGSVYQSFESVEQFVDLIVRLRESPPEPL